MESMFGEIDEIIDFINALEILEPKKKVLFLFDVDGTLTLSRLKAPEWLRPWLAELRGKVDIGFVGGSDLPKQKEQIGEDVMDIFDYCFAENGLVAFKGHEELNSHSIKKETSEKQMQAFINFCISYIADLKLPVKRGTFVEYRTGMLNICPVGRNCSQDERIQFYELDKTEKIREKMIAAIKAEFPDLSFTYSIGGQISFDAFPHGWDKTYCLQFVENKGYEEIHFLGDKTYKGGNDHEIFEDSRTIGHTTISPENTREIVDAEIARLCGTN